MKRMLIGIASASLVVAAIGVALANSGEDSKPDAQVPSTSVPSRPSGASDEDFNRELNKRQLKEQAALKEKLKDRERSGK
jgi:hypothetical protein